MDINQFAEFSAAVVRSLPRGIDSTTAQGWIENQKGLQKFLAGLCPESESNFRYDKRTDGWKLLENAPRRLTSTNIEVVSFLKGNEIYINGEEMARRAVKLDANLGQEDAEFLLENQKDIPVKLREFYLVFPKTKWEDVYGCRSVVCLYWSDGRWILFFYWLVDGFGGSVRLVRSRK